MITIVNMIPQTRSGETNDDSEANLAVNPANPLQIAGTAFTPDPMGGSNAPIYVSADGGNTWSLNSIVPSAAGSSIGTGDITPRFSGSSNNFYAGILRLPGSLRLNTLRTSNFQGGAPMTVLVDRTGVDQPFVQATTVIGGPGVGDDRVYLGLNEYSLRKNAGGNGRTATVDLSLSAGTAPPPAGFNSVRIESRNTGTGILGQNGPQVRPAIHPDGTIYAAFYGWRGTVDTFPTITSDVVVVRDDNWGSGATPFTSLVDSDGLAGKRVVTGVTFTWNATLGADRLGGDLALAVDLTDPSTIYIAWADQQTAGYTLHVRRSTDRGATWSADLLTIANAKNPGLAINSHNKVAFLYQQVTGSGANQRWATHLRRTTDGATWDDLILANTRVTNWQGDYAYVMAAGKDFYGIFCADNVPDLANFPNGVVYQRNHDFALKQLLANDDITLVANSIDPYFFKIEEGPAALSDFYVRDWTDTASSGDSGLEPSTHPYFFTTSDVWNRQTNAPGGFNANNQPQNEEPINGSGAAGDNFAFCRIFRNTAGSAETVDAHFLYSEFGTGSNYQDAGNPAGSTVGFAAADTVQVLASGHSWHLDATSSNHLCLAVEISTPSDPIVPPSLLGRAPGWPTTDLIVLNDNNKAQRNMGVHHVLINGLGQASFYATIHNAATFTRTLNLRYEAAPEVLKQLPGATIAVAGGRGKAFKSGDTLRFANMLPGENRWLALTFEAIKGKEGQLLPVVFFEIVEGTAVNGFAIAPQPSPWNTVSRDSLTAHASTFARMAALFDINKAKGESLAALQLLHGQEISEKEYVGFLRAHLESIAACLSDLQKSRPSKDLFGTQGALKNIALALQHGAPSRLAPAHSALLNKLDAFLTMLQKSMGDTADILQNVAWQYDLYNTLPSLTKLECSKRVLMESKKFIIAYQSRNVGNKDYPPLIERLLRCYWDTAEAVGKSNLLLEDDLANMQHSLNSLSGLQKAQRDYLLKLQSLAS